MRLLGAVLCGVLAVSGSLRAEQGSKVLTDFEDEAQLGLLRFSDAEGELSTLAEAVTSAQRCLKVTFHKGAPYPGFTGDRETGFPLDWRGYDYLRADVFNPNPRQVSYNIRIDDAQSTGYPTRFNSEGLAFRPGRNTLELHLPSLRTTDGSRNLDLGRITAFIVFLDRPRRDVTLYFDNIRLEKAPAAPQVEGLHRFDFGPADAPVFAGFQAVTPKTAYDEERGFGWRGAEGLRAANQGWPDSLAGDDIHGNLYGRWEFPFALRVPNGTYRLRLIARGKDQDGMPTRSWRVLAEGKPVIEEVMTPERFYSREVLFRWLDALYRPGLDAWATYIEPRFGLRTVEVKVEDGRLDLVFDTCAVSALIVYPAAKEAQVAPILAQLERDRKKEFYDKHYYVQLPQPERPVEEALKGREDEPAVVFTPHYLRPIHPRSVPLEGEVGRPIDLWSAPGETEPATIAVLARRDLKGVQVEVSEMKAVGEGPAAPLGVEVRLVRYSLARAGKGVFTPRADALVPVRPVDIPKGMTRQYWLTFRVPRGARGAYEGKVTVRGGSFRAEVPVRLEVLPIRLAERTDVTFAWYYTSPGRLNYFYDRFQGMEKEWRRELEREMADMAEHGANALLLPAPNITSVEPDGTIEVDFSGLEPWVQAMRRTGLGLRHTNQMNVLGLANYRLMRSGLREFSPPFNRAYKELIRQIVAWSERERIPLVIYAVDEPRETLLNPWNRNLADTIKYLKLIAQVPGARSTVTPMADVQNGVDYLPMLDYLDIVQTHPWERSARMIARARKPGKPILWLYNAGIDRLSFGFAVWRLEAKGRWQWHYQWHFFPFDPFNPGWGVVYASPEGPLPTVGYEWAREGIDDYRYLFTLAEEMKAAGPERRDLVARARRLLEEIRREVPPWPTEGLETGEEVGEAYGGPLNAKLDGWRRALADLILQFQKAGR